MQETFALEDSGERLPPRPERRGFRLWKTMKTVWTDMADILPEGKKGLAKIKHCVVSEKESKATFLRAAISGRHDEGVRDGRYAQLFVNDGLMMSDTALERRSNTGLIWNAEGHVIVAGLGLGMVVIPLLAKPEVTEVTVIEKYQDVVDLVETPLREALGKNSEKLNVIVADIFDYKPPKGVKYDTLYFDIWPDICTDNLKEMATLHRKFARRKTSKKAWMDSWMKSRLQYEASRSRGYY